MKPFILQPHLAPGLVPHTLALDGVPQDTTTEPVTGEIWWRWADDKAMELQPLGYQNAGYTLTVLFPNPDRREVLLYLRNKTADGIESVRNIREAVQTVYSPPVPPTLESVEYVADATVELTFHANGGTGDIRIFRDIDGEGFGEIDSVPFNDTFYQDITADINGAYSYKLTQDGVDGESNIRSDTVTGEGGETGTPPSGLTGSFDTGDGNVDLSWTNNGGTGNNVIERKLGPSGGFGFLASVASGTTSYEDTDIFQGGTHQTYYYRVRNESCIGYSNEESVYIPPA